MSNVLDRARSYLAALERNPHHPLSPTDSNVKLTMDELSVHEKLIRQLITELEEVKQAQTDEFRAEFLLLKSFVNHCRQSHSLPDICCPKLPE